MRLTLAALLDVDAATRATLHRGALLHDVGKLGVSNRILDKAGQLDPAERDAVRHHPQWSMEILSRVGAFGEVARIAAAHHERLDGSGCDQELTAAQLDQPSRILGVADVAEALSARRPYWPALDPHDVLRIMRSEADRALDPNAFASLEQVLPEWSAGLQPARHRAEGA